MKVQEKYKKFFYFCGHKLQLLLLIAVRICGFPHQIKQKSLMIYSYLIMMREKESDLHEIFSSDNIVAKIDEKTRIVTVEKQKSKLLTFTIKKLPDFHYMQKQKRQEYFQSLSEQFQSEFEIATKVKSPSILKYMNHQIDYSYACMFHQNIDCSLAQLINSEKLSYPNKIQIFSCLIQSLKTLRSQRICHRNIRPENIAICFQENGLTAKLMNFSRAVQLKQYLYGIQLKPNEINRINKSIYTAPEILQGKVHSFQSDIWSLGILFYEMLFKEPIEMQIIQSHIILEFPQETPDWLRDFIEKILRLNPLERHKLQDLEAITRCAEQCVNTTDIKRKRT